MAEQAQAPKGTVAHEGPHARAATPLEGTTALQSSYIRAGTSQEAPWPADKPMSEPVLL